MTETYLNGDYLTIQEEAFTELSKTLTPQDAMETAPNIAVYGLEMQNKGFNRLIKIANEIIEIYSTEERNKTQSDKRYHSQIVSDKGVEIRSLLRLIRDNNDLIISILKSPK